jgi:hypothetical protein
MWWTSAGERILTGAEWELFREGLSTLWDEVEMSEEEDGPGTTGIQVFDELPKLDRLALLALVAKGLTDENEACPDLTARTEGSVAAIFAHLRYLIGVEIDIQEEGIASGCSGGFRSRTIREIVLVAARHASVGCGGLHTESGSTALVGWMELIDELRDRILWDDRDYLVGDAFLDLDPAMGDTLKEQLGIPEHYFSAVAVERTQARLENNRATLRRICGRPRAWGGDAMVEPDTTNPGA